MIAAAKPPRHPDLAPDTEAPHSDHFLDTLNALRRGGLVVVMMVGDWLYGIAGVGFTTTPGVVTRQRNVNIFW